MINPTILSAKLAGLVGFRSPFNPEYQILDADNQTSRSGYFVTDNPFVKIEMIKDCMDYAAINDCDFNTYLKRKASSSIVSVANRVFNENDFIDRQVLYKNANNKLNTETLPVKGFVGYRITPELDNNIGFTIKRVFLEFEGTGDITLVLFNSAKSEVVYSQKVTISSTLQEEILNWTCSNTSGFYAGNYYLGYFTEGLTVKPYARDYNNSNCQSVIDRLCINPILFASTNSDKLPNLASEEGCSLSAGLNPDITVCYDYTDLMIQNERLFARAIQLDMQIAFLSEAMASIRSNRNERISAAQIQIQIEGETGEDNVKVTGLRPQLFGAIKTIQKEIKKFQDGYFGKDQILIDTLT